jgi:DNA-binding MarR family transcriptional regulator
MHFPTDNQEADDTVLSDRVETSIRNISHLLRTQAGRFARQYGLTGPQLAFLRRIHSDGEVSVGELAEASNLSQATITGVADRLERRGLIRKQRSESDRRRVLVRLTPAAARMFQTNPELLRHRVADALQSLSRSEQDLIMNVLARIERLMREADRIPNEEEDQAKGELP